MRVETVALTWTPGNCDTTQSFTVKDEDGNIPTGGNISSGITTTLRGLTPGASYDFTVTGTCGGQTSAASAATTVNMGMPLHFYCSLLCSILV